MTLCAWCEAEIVIPRGILPRDASRRTAGAVSHGICPSCVATRIAALPRPPLQQALALR